MALFLLSLVCLLMGLDYISTGGGRFALLIAGVSALAGYLRWPKIRR